MKLIFLPLKIVWTLLTRPLVIIALVAVLFLICYQGGLIQNESGPLQFVHKTLSPPNAVEQVADSIVRACPNPEKSYSRLLILPLRDDREQALETEIREAFRKREEVGHYKLVEPSVLSASLEKMQNFALGEDAQKNITREEALEAAKAADAELVLYGQLDTFVPEGDSHKINGRFHLVDVATAKTLVTSRFSNMADSGKTDGTSSLPGMAPLIRFGGVLAFVLAWPFAMIPLMRRIIARESNRDNFLAMILMAAIPLILVLVFLGGIPSGFLAWTSMVVFFAVTIGWIGFVMNQVAAKP